MGTRVNNFTFNRMMACALVMPAIAIGCAAAQTSKPGASKSEPSAVTAIDILLEPDDTMIEHAHAVNERLLKVFLNGFALDAAHRPHITLVQRFVLTENLDKTSRNLADVGALKAVCNVCRLTTAPSCSR